MYYTYEATLTSIHDADTVTVTVDLGFDVTVKVTLRLLGLNAPELATPEGKTARDALTALLPTGVRALRVVTVKREKYGRMLATIYIADQDVNAWLIAQGYAVPYFGHGAR